MNATLAHRGQQNHGRLSAEESIAYRVRIRTLGWTQNKAARQVRKDAGYFSNWLRGRVTSAVIRLRLDRALLRAEQR